ncbi:MAG: FAD-binding oxidoreductase [Hyphomicrobium sp.]
MPLAVVHCRTSLDVVAAVKAAGESNIPLSVRGGGHDWAGRALCGGIVVDLSAMNAVAVDPGRGFADIAGGARAADAVAATDPLGLAVVTGSVGAVGMAGLTLGGGYGPLIGRFGLALDNLLAAQVVLADGRMVVASERQEPDLFWALRGGGGNFGVVVSMRHRVHPVPKVYSGMLAFTLDQAQTALQRCPQLAASRHDELTVQIAMAIGREGHPLVLVVPTWSGDIFDGEVEVKPFLDIGTPIAGGLQVMSYGTSITPFDSFLVNGRRAVMETCWVPMLDQSVMDTFIEAMRSAVSSGCAIVTHDFKGAASRVPLAATAFGLRRDHMLVEILAAWDDAGGPAAEQLHRDWARRTRERLSAQALPGGYPNLLAARDGERVAMAYGSNYLRLRGVKRKYDPDNLFRSAIQLAPVADEDRVQRKLRARP